MNTDITKLVGMYKTLSSSVFVGLFFGIPCIVALLLSVSALRGYTQDGDTNNYETTHNDVFELTYNDSTNTYSAGGSIWYRPDISQGLTGLDIDVIMLGGELTYTNDGTLVSKNNYIEYHGLPLPPHFALSNKQLQLLTGDLVGERHAALVKKSKDSIPKTRDYMPLTKPSQTPLINNSIVDTFDLGCVTKASKYGPLCQSKIGLFINKMPYYNLIADTNYQALATQIQQTGYKKDFCDNMIHNVSNMPWKEISIKGGTITAGVFDDILSRCDPEHKLAYNRLVDFASVIVAYHTNKIHSKVVATVPLFQLVSAQTLIANRNGAYSTYYILLRGLIADGIITPDIAISTYTNYGYIKQIQSEEGSHKEQGHMPHLNELTSLLPPEYDTKKGHVSSTVFVNEIPVVRSAKSIVREHIEQLADVEITSTLSSPSPNMFDVSLTIQSRQQNNIATDMTLYLLNDTVYVSNVHTNNSAFDEHISHIISTQDGLDINGVVTILRQDYDTYSTTARGTRACSEALTILKKIPKSVNHTCMSTNGEQKIRMTMDIDQPFSITLVSIDNVVISSNATRVDIQKKMNAFITSQPHLDLFAKALYNMSIQRNVIDEDKPVIKTKDITELTSMFRMYMRTDDVVVLAQDPQGKKVFRVERVMGKTLRFRGTINLHRNNQLSNISYVASNQTIPITDLTFYLITKNVVEIRDFSSDPLGYIKTVNPQANFMIMRAL